MLSNVFTICGNKLTNGLDEYQDHSYHQPKITCVGHPRKIFDTYINQKLVEEWMREFNGGRFCVCLDILLTNWDEFENPTKVYKKLGYYDLVRDLVRQHTITGLFYHAQDYYKSKDLQVGKILDYSARLTTWSSKLKNVKLFMNDSDKIILKLNCQNTTGLDLDNYKHEMLLAECCVKITHLEKCDDILIVSVDII